MTMIAVYGLTKRFGTATAVEDISLTIAEGEVLALLGPNGAGKTTTIRMLSGIISPTAGYAEINGKRTDGNVEALHETIGLLTETPGFYNNLSARRNLEFYAGFYPGINIPRQVEKYMKLMGLWERRTDKVGIYSKGMKQRLALARALIHEPRVLFLDEPTAGLDPEASREVRDTVSKLSGEGRTIVLSTHNLTEAESLSHRVAVMKTRLLALDTAANLRSRLFRREITVSVESVPEALTEAIGKLPFVQELRRDGTRLHIRLDNPEKNRPELVKGIVEAGGRVLAISEEVHSLEDIYLSLVQENNRES